MKLLRFRPPESPGKDEVRKIFAWPVIAVPIRFWDFRPDSLDILEFAVLGLSECGVMSREKLIELLALPIYSEELLEKTVSRLKTLRLLDEYGRITPEGRNAYQGESDSFGEYKDGYLFYDLVRGGFFSYVHEGDFKTKQYDPVVEIKPRATVPEPMHLSHLALQTIRKYNRVINEGSHFGINNEPEDIIDQAVDEEIESLDFARRQNIGEAAVVLDDEPHISHLMIEVRGGVYYSGEEYYSLSAFSSLQTDSYYNTLNILEQIEVQNALRELKDGVRSKPGASAKAAINYNNLEKMLQQRCAYLDEMEATPQLKEEIRRAEFDHLKTIQGLNEKLTNRKSPVNLWANLVELVLEFYWEKCKHLTFDNIWEQRHQFSYSAERWLTRELEEGYWCFMRREVPEAVFGKTKKMLQRLNPDYHKNIGSFRKNGAVDALAALFIATLRLSVSIMPKELRQFMETINRNKVLLEDIMQVVKPRNEIGAHGNLDIYKLTDEDYLKLLDNIRDCTLKVIKALGGNIEIVAEGSVAVNG